MYLPCMPSDSSCKYQEPCWKRCNPCKLVDGLAHYDDSKLDVKLEQWRSLSLSLLHDACTHAHNRMHGKCKLFLPGSCHYVCSFFFFQEHLLSMLLCVPGPSFSYACGCRRLKEEHLRKLHFLSGEAQANVVWRSAWCTSVGNRFGSVSYRIRHQDLNS